MRVQLSQQATEILGKSELVIITERVDDVALLIGQMVTMGFPEVLDRHIPRHWTQRGISWGWTAVIWLAYILTEGDHRKVSVEAYLKGMHHTLSQLTAQVIEPLDFSDDRLSHLLAHLSKPTYWHQIERDLNARSIEVYAWSQDVIRCDATTVSGDHEVTAGGLVQFGHSKDDPTRPQIKVMMGSLDPLGMPLSTDVLSGERADDGFYIPMMERIRTGLNKTGLLFVGDCKMSALDTRAYLARHQDWYLSPLPLTGGTAEAMDAWITTGVTKGEAGELEQIVRTNDRGQRVLQKIRYHIPRITRQTDTIAALTQRFGWKAFVTNAGPTRLSLQAAVLCYRHEYRVERIFHRLKSRVHIAPLFVKLNEQIEGLTYLLTLGVRVLTVMEFVLRRSLQYEQASLPSLHPENKQKRTDTPTAERILKAFSGISLTIIKNTAGEDILRRLTPLSGLQEDILQRLGLGATLYGQLEIQTIGI